VVATGVLEEVSGFWNGCGADGVFTLSTFGTRKKYIVIRHNRGEISKKNILRDKGDIGEVSVMLKVAIITWLVLCHDQRLMIQRHQLR
jgi:hypothetical protein